IASGALFFAVGGFWWLLAVLEKMPATLGKVWLAIAMLPILTGNVGINGGNSGARESTYTITIERLPVL
ncbi:DmsC/YnfH family molybdoenzyme membrane anchor subunit, partial [Klebsiella pneumoniae]|uniref:DmsC/YnfH family molybdoenzyme membrane anchor subunit n=1 Tax=Klebsiella pneumoniae TaxID=573 RepID=UPI003F07D5B9